MFFLPYRLDISLYRVPLLTLSACLVCVLVFVKQISSSHLFEQRVHDYCTQQTSPELHAVLDAVKDDEVDPGCANVLLGIREAHDPAATLNRLAGESRSLTFYKDAKQDLEYKRSLLQYGYDGFLLLVPKDLTDKLAYRPGEYDPRVMLTSVFAHGSWSHLLGNLLFFFIFAACVESALGYAGFAGVFVLMAVVTSLAYSHSVSAVGAPTIGLSGVCMGMMALMTVLLPGARVWCFFWFFFFFRRFTVPILALSAWYIGWNVYDLKHVQVGDTINYMAHVSGAVCGIALGLAIRLLAPGRMQELKLEAAG